MFVSKHIEYLGDFRFSKVDKQWICHSENVFPGRVLEIIFDVESAEQKITNKILLTKKFLQHIEPLKEKIYETISKSFAERPVESVKQMWFLSSVNLENDNKTWKIVFEPYFNIDTIHNHILRFTLVKGKIIWRNF